MKKGQTLVALLVFIVIAVTLTAAAVTMNIINSEGNSKMQQGMIAYDLAESGAENAILRLLRNPDYSGESLTIGDGTADVSVSGTPPVIISTGKIGRTMRKIQVNLSLDGAITILSWKEIE